MNLCLETDVLNADALHENLQLFQNQRLQFADCNPVNFVNIEVANGIAYFLCVLSQDAKRSL